MNNQLLALIDNFKNNQSLANLQPIVNNGIRLKHLKSNQWTVLKLYKFPYQRVIPLYDKVNGVMTVTGVGVF